MWQKIKCWLGWHEYKQACTVWKTKGACYKYRMLDIPCNECKHQKPICKHCGKVKK